MQQNEKSVNVDEKVYGVAWVDGLVIFYIQISLQKEKL
jgi:hypothetical protein